MMGEVTEDRAAVERVVRDHAGWVFAAARRRVGDAALAEDVTQAVFLLYWRKGAGSAREGRVAGWLHRAVRYCAANALRLRRIRERHEREAAMERKEGQPAGWTEVEEEFEGAVDRLPEKDRQAVVLRFYRGLSLKEVGAAVGIGEEAARKRVDRAVEKLRELLAAKGVEAETVGLSGMLLAHAGEGGAAGLVERVMGGIGSDVAGGIARGAGKMMVMAKMKVAAVAMIVAAGAVGTGIAIRPAESPAAASPIVAAPKTGDPDVRKLAMELADQVQAEIGKMRRLGYSYQQWAKDLKEEEIAGWTGAGGPVEWAGEYTFDAQSGVEYLSHIGLPDDPARRYMTEVGGGNGRWTEVRDEQPGSSRKWARIVSARPIELGGTPMTPHAVIREMPLDAALRAVQDVEVVKESLDGQECYRVAMVTRTPVHDADGKQVVGFGLGVYRVWLAIGKGLVPVRCEEYVVDPEEMGGLPRFMGNWTLPMVMKPGKRMWGLLVQKDLVDAGGGVWVARRKMSYAFARNDKGERYVMARETLYADVAVNEKVTPKGAPSIPAEAMKGVLKDMVRGWGK